MEITVPIYVRVLKQASGTTYVGSPLLQEMTPVRGPDLGRMLARLGTELRRKLTELSRLPSQDSLLAWHVPQRLPSEVLSLFLRIQNQRVPFNILAVKWHRQGKQVIQLPVFPSLWFELGEDESLASRTTEVLQRYVLDRLSDDSDFNVRRESLSGRAWVESLCLSIPKLSIRKPQKRSSLAALFAGEVTDGADQLHRIGRCLDTMDLDELAEPLGVTPLLDRLQLEFNATDRHGVVLVGPAGSGKTALIEGWVRRRRQHELRPRLKKLLFELSASRLCSGMSALGQWESRLIGILRFASRMDHILYFPDFLGLYDAGVTRDSDFSVADLIRGQWERLPVRMITDMSPESWAIVRDRDPGLASRFSVLSVEALDLNQSMPLLLGVIRNLEARYRCQFTHEVLPEVLGLYDRFVRDAALPGKAVAALQRMASTRPGKAISRRDVLQEFHRRTGIAPALLDRKQKLSREVVEGTLRNEVVGQPAALRAVTDRVLVSAARMNDLTRPMGVFLFLGSTGVGKTETAKAIAKFLFGEDGLVRIDMNELSGPTAVATLVGTFDSPSGRLTSAIRQRPHCVLLLDEIEKAHPAVLDVLLQVLGEARLTDARGRTVDFSGAMIIMTSNLGAEDTARRVGFGGGEDADQHARLRAVRNYFRPEFFNRIDSIVHFGRLDRESVQQIAHLQLARALNRDGLTRRQTIMDIDPQVISWAVDSGFDSALGARAIKRSLERHLIDQVAARLTEIDPSLPTLVMLKPGKHANAFAKSPTAPVEISVISLPQVTAKSPVPVRQTPQNILTTAQDLFAQLVVYLPQQTVRYDSQSGKPTAETLRYLALKEFYHQANESLQKLKDSLQEPGLQRPVAIPTFKQVSWGYQWYKTRSLFSALAAADDIRAFLEEALVTESLSESKLLAWRAERAVQRFQHVLSVRNEETGNTLVIRSFGSPLRWREREEGPREEGPREDRQHPLGDFTAMIAGSLSLFLADSLELEVELTKEESSQYVYRLEGLMSGAAVSMVSGTLLWMREGGGLELIDVRSQTGGDVPSEIRYLAHEAGPMIDLQTGVATMRLPAMGAGQENLTSALVDFWERI